MSGWGATVTEQQRTRATSRPLPTVRPVQPTRVNASKYTDIARALYLSVQIAFSLIIPVFKYSIKIARNPTPRRGSLGGFVKSLFLCETVSWESSYWHGFRFCFSSYYPSGGGNGISRVRTADNHQIGFVARNNYCTHNTVCV